MRRVDQWLPEGMGFGGLGEKIEGRKKYRWAVTKWSWGYKVQHRV